MERPIIEIDEEKCDGCGQCVLDCAEGALAVINSSDLCAIFFSFHGLSFLFLCKYSEVAVRPGVGTGRKGMYPLLHWPYQIKKAASDR